MKSDRWRRFESPSNPKVKALAALKERRERERSGEFVVEGAREATRALAADLEVLSVIYCPELAAGAASIESLLADAAERRLEIVEFSAAAFKRLSVRQNPDGIALHAKRPVHDLKALAGRGAGLVLVIDGVEKPGNLGAMLRTAEGVGAAGVIISGRGTDLENPNVVRASQGSVFGLPLAVADAASALALLRAEGHKLVATTPAATLPHWSADYGGPVAVLVGAEDSGLSSEWLAAADVKVKIPMRGGGADSLNVSVATAVVLYEALRQRAGRVAPSQTP